MEGSNKRYSWIAAVLSGLVCGLLGPLIGVVVVLVPGVVNGTSSAGTRELLQAVVGMWPYAEMMFGVPGFVFGCCGGLLLKTLVSRSPSTKAIIFRAVLLGLALGAAVPFWLLDKSWKLAGAYALLGAFSGIICALLVLWLLCSIRLLDLTASKPIRASK